MKSEKIIKALISGAVNVFEFDVTTGRIMNDIIGEDGVNYTKKAGISLPYTFDNLISYYFGSDVKCRMLTGSNINCISSQYLLDLYLSGELRCEVNFFCPITNEYYRTLYFLYEDDVSSHIMSLAVSRVIYDVEDKFFTQNGDKMEQLKVENEKVYKAMLDEQPCGVFAYTYPGYHIVTANAEALRMFGCTSIEQIQERIGDVIGNIYYPSQESLERLKSLRTKDDTVDYECIFNKGLDNEFYVIAKTKIIYSLDGRRIIYSTYVDASEMHALQVTLGKAEEGTKAKSTFLFNMSHDLRTPMNAILGYAELINSHWDERDTARDYLRKLMESSKFLLFFLNNAIELASLEKNGDILKESLWNARRFNDMLDAIIENEVRDKNIKFSRSVNIEHNDVMCDASKLRLVFLNILSNAIKYTPTGGSISMILEEIPSEKSGYAQFKTVVTDTGIGISPDYLPHIFENFTREKKTTLSGIQGTGLGMSVVKKLIDLMGGSITVESNVGKGTKVTVLLSHRIVSREELVKYAEKEKGIDNRIIVGKRILLAEDNELNAEITMIILSDAGFVCEHVSDGAEAFEAIKNHSVNYYDLVLMDIQMPVMDGYQATRAIRMLDDERSKIPIVAMTANALEDDKRAAFAVGMNGHISKPIEISKLMETLYCTLI